MRILVVKNKKLKSNYATCIHALLEDIYREKGYQIEHSEYFKDGLVSDNTIHFVTLPSVSSIGRFFQQQKLASFIKKHKIDLLVQQAGSYLKHNKLTQLLIVDDIENLPALNKINRSKIALVTYSQSAKQTIVEKGFTNTIHIIPFFTGALYQPISWSTKQQVKIDHTEGREFFYVSRNFKSIEDILKLLKAFTGFKKWQHSSMKLVLAGKFYVPPSDWEEKINTYKFREDVLVYNHTEAEKVRLLAGAYACIHLPEKDNDLLPLLQSIQCHTPVISFESPSVKEYAADAALVVAPDNYEELTQQMILLYKDENLRNRLTEHCGLQANEYSKENAINTLQAILQL